MNRAELSSKLKSIRLAIDAIENQPKPEYKTTNKYVEKIGFIHELKTLTEVAKTYKFVKNNIGDLEDVAKELGITIESTNKFMGHSLTVWKDDSLTRIKELNDQARLQKLKEAEEVLKKHRTDDDIFYEDVDSISDILETI
jgi:gas vesicle protein